MVSISAMKSKSVNSGSPLPLPRALTSAKNSLRRLSPKNSRHSSSSALPFVSAPKPRKSGLRASFPLPVPPFAADSISVSSAPGAAASKRISTPSSSPTSHPVKRPTPPPLFARLSTLNLVLPCQLPLSSDLLRLICLCFSRPFSWAALPVQFSLHCPFQLPSPHNSLNHRTISAALPPSLPTPPKFALKSPSSKNFSPPIPTAAPHSISSPPSSSISAKILKRSNSSRNASPSARASILPGAPNTQVSSPQKNSKTSSKKFIRIFPSSPKPASISLRKKKISSRKASPGIPIAKFSTSAVSPRKKSSKSLRIATLPISSLQIATTSSPSSAFALTRAIPPSGPTPKTISAKPNSSISTLPDISSPAFPSTTTQSTASTTSSSSNPAKSSSPTASTTKSSASIPPTIPSPR